MSQRGRLVAQARAARQRWMIIRVTLTGQAGEELPDPPGRDLLANASHTFADLASAIDRAFARWDLAHLHEFELADGTRIVSVDDEGLGTGEFDEALEPLAKLSAATTFEYTFDVGAGWSHACVVLRDDIDPRRELGSVPAEITPLFGWGAIPDQYGRVAPEADED